MYEALYSLYSIGLIISIVCVIGVALQKPANEQKIMMLISFFAFLILLGYWFGIQSDGEEVSIIADKLIYFGECSLYFLWIVFFVRYYKIRAPKLLFPILGVLAVILLAVILTMDQHHLFYNSYYFFNATGMPVFGKEYAIFYYVYMGIKAVIAVGLIILVIYQSIRRKDNEKWEPFLLAAVALIPALIQVGNIYQPAPIDLTPIGILLSELLLIILFYRLKIYDINDTARQLIIDSMGDAIVVVDHNYLYKEANEQAIVLFPEFAKAKQDSKLADISSYLDQLLKSEDTNLFYSESAIYQPCIKTIRRQSLIRGYVIWHLDVTEAEKRKELVLNYQRDLETEVIQKTDQIQEIQDQLILSFANLIELRESAIGEHVRRISIYVKKIAERLYQNGDYPEIVNERFIKRLQSAAPLHDVGKIMVPESILNKPGELTEEEFALIKEHPENGKNILINTLATIRDREYYNMVCDVVMYHHERWIGGGYPEALSGTDIPLSARIMAIADAFDALTSARPYKETYDYDTAFEIIKKERGLQFDPVLVDALLSVRNEIEAIASN